MLTPKLRWLLAALIATLVLTAGALIFWQDWQRSHFSCQGEMDVFTADSRTFITLRYIFNGDKGVVILRGLNTPEKAEQQAINHNVWFSFTRKGDDFFLHSQNVTSNLTGSQVSSDLVPILPVFYLQSGESFYLRIARVDGDSRLFFTSNVPSMFCKS